MPRIPYFDPNHPAEEDPDDAIYSTARWKRYRKRYLRKYPLCQPCLDEDDREELAIIVHHKVEIREGGAIYDENNCLGTCRVHHNRIHNARRR